MYEVSEADRVEIVKKETHQLQLHCEMSRREAEQEAIACEFEGFQCFLQEQDEQVERFKRFLRKQAERKQAEQERAEREQAERERAQREQVELEQAELEQGGREQAEVRIDEVEQVEHEQAEPEKVEVELDEVEQAEAEPDEVGFESPKGKSDYFICVHKIAMDRNEALPINR